MQQRWLRGLTIAVLVSGFSAALGKEWVSGIIWPEPRKVDPGVSGSPPSDAVILFNGTDLSAWHGGDKWIVENGSAIAKGGGITTKESFGDCQLHVEWAAPEKVEGSGQGRGNSGVYLMGQYEVQILDSYDNTTYFDGQAGALYKTKPPLVNACRKPGEWQTYDIIFRAPKFDTNGSLLKPACITVLHNGVLVQDHTELLGKTEYEHPPQYSPHADRLPIHIQFHGNPVRFRNIWIREIPDILGQRPE